MAREALLKHNLQFLFADVTDFPNSGVGPPTTAANSLLIGTATLVQIDCTNLALGGGARQSAKVDLTERWSTRWALMACTEHTPTPVDNEKVDFYWAPSTSSTAGTGNTGGTSGVDAAYTNTAGSLGQMQAIGNLPLIANVINIGLVGTFTPLTRYGSLIVINDAASDAFNATVMDEVHFVLNEIVEEIQ